MVEVGERYGKKPDAALKWLVRLTVKLPPEVIKIIDHPDEQRKKVRIADIRLGAREPSREEEGDYLVRQRKEGKRGGPTPDTAADVVEVEDPDKDAKADLTEYDQATLHVNSNTFVMPLECPEAFLAARTLEVAATLHKGQSITINMLVSRVVRNMSETEREMFSNKKNKLKSKSPKDGEIPGLLRSLIRTLGVIREASGDKFKLYDDVDFKITFGAVVEPEPGQHVILPPGTPRARILAEETGIIPPEDILFAADILAKGFSERLNERDAIDLLDFIRSRIGKRAVLAVLKSQDRSYNELLDIRNQAHQQVRRSLSEGGYFHALRSRTIAGNTSRGRGGVMQVGGRLDGAVTKWHITSRHSDLSGTDPRKPSPKDEK